MGGRSLFAEGTAFSWLFLTKWGRNGDARIREKACAFGAAPLFELRIRGYAANLTLMGGRALHFLGIVSGTT